MHIETLIIIVTLVIDLCTTSAFANAARLKGYEDETSTVWLLGIFCSMLTAALYTIALPDKAGGSTEHQSAPAENELPSL